MGSETGLLETPQLTSLGQHERAAVIHYGQACRVTSLEARTKKIKSLLQSHFNGHPDSNLLIQVSFYSARLPKPSLMR